jgi:DNA polymerase
MGIDPIWRLKTAQTSAGEPLGLVGSALDSGPEPLAPPPATAGPVAAPMALSFEDIAALEWAALPGAVASCRSCGLCEHRRQTVFGVGDPAPDWLFIGEGPGADEDQQGEPFVGPAGQLLDAMLAALALDRSRGVFIANAVKCRPPGNRTPSAEEMAACRPFLTRQIELLKPRLIVLLGKAAAHSILGEDGTLASMRGKVFAFSGVPVVVSYHPAYLLRSPADKAKSWEDLCLAKQTLAGLSARN